MNLSKNTSTALLVVGVVLIIIGLLEHFLISTLIVPHLAIYLGILGIIIGGIGAWGMMGSRAS